MASEQPSPDNPAKPPISAEALPAPVGPGPSTVVCVNDPGDDTQRNFRYQHAFGVILLVESACNKRPYRGVFCEHHEDMLAERTDGRFDAYQIKTRKAEEGGWLLNDDGFKHSIGRFVSLDMKFPNHVHEYFFVSNSPCLDTVQSDRPHRSPVKLCEAVCSARAPSELSERALTAFRELRDACRCGDTQLWNIIRRLRLVYAPGRDDIFGILAHEHLPQLPACSQLSAVRLNDLRDELIDLVFRAAARGREDPSRHVLPMGPERDDVRIRGKRVLVADLHQRILDRASSIALPPFRYTMEPERLSGTSTPKSMSVLVKKLERAGLHAQVDLMRRRALDAERYLLECSADPALDLNERVLDHVTSVVSAECIEAHANARAQTAVPAGAFMLNDVYRRLRDKATSDVESVAGLPYEVLTGMAALLTSECKIWWSEHFDLNEQAA